METYYYILNPMQQEMCINLTPNTIMLNERE